MPGKELNDTCPIRGFDNMRDKRLVAQFLQAHGTAVSQRVSRVDDKGEFVAQEFNCAELPVLWDERDHPYVESVIEYLSGNIARENAVNRDFHIRVQPVVAP